ncbi:MAG: hypothetical protein PHQ74_00765 [Crocinitomicaceae bacterium]|nr:hypothetical protein [Crocinitomicaceae bacterium]
MKEEVKHKLDQIADIWNHFIWEYDYCKRKIKFTSELETNYFGEILGYFHDTLDIIFCKRNSSSHSDRFSNQISLLQSIYVQQDFIEELLLIFKCGIVKGDLKIDSSYYINRDIRNELVGHPIRKLKKELISSCLFSYDGDENKVVYLRYHKDNNYKFEEMEFAISEIIKRHDNFLNTYFDKILEKLERILVSFSKEIEKFEKLIDSQCFTNIIKIASVKYESIFKESYLYDKEALLLIYDRKEVHERYQNLIDKFYKDLRNALKTTREYSIKLFEPIKLIDNSEKENAIFDIKFIDPKESGFSNLERPITYTYELGKIATKRSPMDFKIFSGILKRKCVDNVLVIRELNHMEENIYDDIEFYSAYYLICKELKEA